MMKRITRSDNRERGVRVWKGLHCTDLPCHICQPFLLLESARVVDHRGNEIDASGMFDHFGKGTDDETRATSNIKYRIVCINTSKIYNQFERFFILDTRCGRKRHYLFSELIENEVLVGGHGVLLV